MEATNAWFDTELYLPINFLTIALQNINKEGSWQQFWEGRCYFDLQTTDKVNTGENIRVTTSRHGNFLKIHIDQSVFHFKKRIYQCVLSNLELETCINDNLQEKRGCGKPKLDVPASETLGDDKTVVNNYEVMSEAVCKFDKESIIGDNESDHIDHTVQIKQKRAFAKSKRGKHRKRGILPKSHSNAYNKKVKLEEDSKKDLLVTVSSTENGDCLSDGSASHQYSLRGRRINSRIIDAERGVFDKDEQASDTGLCNKINTNKNINFSREVSESEKTKMCSMENILKRDGPNNADDNEIKMSKTQGAKDKTCKFCSYASSEYFRVYDHVKRKHSQENGVTDFLTELENLKIIKCGTCNIELSSEKQLHFHERKEHARATCQICFQNFKNAVTLKTHIQNIHEAKYRVAAICEDCSATFKSLFALKQHRESVHKRSRSFSCHVCGKKFPNQAQLRRHHRIHGLAEEKRVKCEFCKKSFLYKHNLLRHVELVHSSQSKEEKYHCSYCGKGYTQKLNMISHVQHIHFNIFPYSCKECKATFTKSHFLLDHMMSVHKQTGVKIPESTRNQRYGKDDEDKFTCAFCSKCFVHKVRLIEHVHLDHSKAFPFLCHLCNQGFLNKSFLCMHSLKAHKVIMSDDSDFPESSFGTGEILQIISSKTGQPFTVVSSPDPNAHPKNMNEEVQNADEDNKLTTPSADAPSDGSTVLVEVASDSTTYSYVIETPNSLGESGTISVAKDIAHLLLAAEQSIQEGIETGTDGDGHVHTASPQNTELMTDSVRGQSSTLASNIPNIASAVNPSSPEPTVHCHIIDQTDEQAGQLSTLSNISEQNTGKYVIQVQDGQIVENTFPNVNSTDSVVGPNINVIQVHKSQAMDSHFSYVNDDYSDTSTRTSVAYDRETVVHVPDSAIVQTRDLVGQSGGGNVDVIELAAIETVEDDVATGDRQMDQGQQYMF